MADDEDRSAELPPSRGAPTEKGWGHASRRRPAQLFAAAKIAFTVLALVLLARLVDPAMVLERVQRTKPFYFLLAALLMVLQIPLVGMRWRLIVCAMSHGQAPVPGLAKIQQITWIAQFFGQVLPFVAGDGMRVLLLREAGSSLRVAFKSTLLDRAIAALALFVIALPAALFSRILGATGAFLPVVVFIGAGLLGAAAMLASIDVIHRFGTRWRVLGAITETVRDLRDILFSWIHAPRIVALCFAVHGISIMAFWLLAGGQDLPFEITDAIAIVPLVLLVSLVPIAAGGWGLREGFVVALLGAAGIGADGALLLSLSFGMVVLLATIPGVVILALSTRGSGQPVVEQV
jgi:glycosyltransferase 2 family protein